METNSNNQNKVEKMFKIFLVVSAITVVVLDILKEAVVYDLSEYNFREFDTFLLFLVVLAILNPFIAVFIFIKSKSVLKRIVVSLFSFAVVSSLPFLLFGDDCGAEPYSYSNPLGFGECDPFFAEPTFDVFPFHFLIVYLAIISWVFYFIFKSIRELKRKLNSIEQSREGKTVKMFSWRKLLSWKNVLFTILPLVLFLISLSSLLSRSNSVFGVLFTVFQWYFLILFLVGAVMVMISAVQFLLGKREDAKKLFLRGITLSLIFFGLYYLTVKINCLFTLCL